MPQQHIACGPSARASSDHHKLPPTFMLVAPRKSARPSSSVFHCDISVHMGGERSSSADRTGCCGRGLQRLSASEVYSRPTDASLVLERDGALVVQRAVPAAECSQASGHVDRALREALQAAGERPTPTRDAAQDCQTDAQAEASVRYFGNVQSLAYRRDLKLHLVPEIYRALRSLLTSVGACLGCLITEDGRLSELAALVSDPGSSPQSLHPDTRMAPGHSHAALYTCFVALQDISLDMGPTDVIPGSHTSEAHCALDRDPAAMSARAIPALLQAGDALIMDSRLIHRGGGNSSQFRRTLLYISLQVPANSPPGSTYSLLEEYQRTSKLSLRHLDRWSAIAQRLDRSLLPPA